MAGKDSSSNVKVVVRVRPQSSREKLEMCEVCVEVDEESKVITLGGGAGRKFTFDKVSGIDSQQADMFHICCGSLIDSLFDGYNASLLAYGQTGSGKTFTMGTNFDLNIDLDLLGIIPRAINQLYLSIQNKVKEDEQTGLEAPEFKISIQFMELYNEEVFDLLDSTTDKTKKSGLRIHEDADGNIHVTGLKNSQVHSFEEAMECLKQGTLGRSTACTNMNVQSSRSHAVFTLFVHQKRWKRIEGMGGGGGDGESSKDDVETMVVCEEGQGKFNFVDLAGSERLKRTGATGERAREGISINCGLLALGNVISALGDPAKIGCHVPYRDSKLTRILQDSLGGNSQTAMIACISPSDCDFMETLNCLNYANRARNIKNRISVNRGVVNESEVQTLKLQVVQLTRQLNDFKMGNFESVGLQSDDLVRENQMLLADNRGLRDKVKVVGMALDDVTNRNVLLLSEREAVKCLNEDDDPDKVEKVMEMMKPYIQEAETWRSKFTSAEKHLNNLTSTSSSPLVANRFRDKTEVISGSTGRNEVMSRSMTHFSGSARPNSQQFNRNNDLINQVQSNIDHLNKLRLEKEHIKTKLETKEDWEKADDDNDDDDEDEDDEDDTSTEETGDLEQLEHDLTDLSSEISIKQRLVDELMGSQKKMFQLKVNYEEKIVTLENKIKLTESERDKIMSNLGGRKSGGDDTKDIKRDYENQLEQMRTKLRRLSSEGREHRRLMQAQKADEERMHTLTTQLNQLKRAKVQLMRRLQEESNRGRQAQQEMKKKLTQMQKQQRCKDVQVRRLQTERDKKDVVLKRKIQEVEAMKKRDILKNKKRPQSRKNVLSWEKLENKIDASVLRKQALLQLESDLEKYVKQRECIRLELEERECEPESSSSHVLRDEMLVVVGNIKQCQQCIMELEGNKRNDIGALVSCLSAGDVVCYLEQCASLAVNKGVAVAQELRRHRELEGRLQHQDLEVQRLKAVVQHLICQKVHYEVSNDVIIGDDDDVITAETYPADGVGGQCAEEGTNSGNNNIDNKNNNDNNNNDDNDNNNNNDNNNDNNNGDNSSENKEGVLFDESSMDNEEDGYMEEADSEYSEKTQDNNKGNNAAAAAGYLLHESNCIGHVRAVLHVTCHGDKLFSCSKDASVKVWDISRGVVLQTYKQHPSSVVMAAYDEVSGSLFAAAAYFVKVYDVRTSAAVACLTSSGSVMNQSEATSNSLTSCPAGEMLIKNVAINRSGNFLYASSGNCVRVWDTRMMRSVCKIQGNHQQAISTMALIDLNHNQSLLATASKDYIIRYYNTNNGVHYVSTKATTTTLQQQHNDIIECMVFHTPTQLLSSSKDKSVLKWDVTAGKCSAKLNAHNSWITGLSIYNNTASASSYVISACQNGTLKIWDTATLTCLSQYDNAHGGGVNCLLTNQPTGLLFTASNDKTIGVWRFRNHEES